MIRFRCVGMRRSGATEIRILQAAHADDARARLIAAGLEPVTIEAAGPSLSNRLLTKFAAFPAAGWHWPVATRARLRHLGLLAVLSLVMTCFITAIGVWIAVAATNWQASRIAARSGAAIARHRDIVIAERIRAAAATAMTTASVSERLDRLAAILPRDAGLIAAERDPAGQLILELEAPDPDQLRPALLHDPLFGSLREIDQASTDRGGLRITYKGRAS